MPCRPDVRPAAPPGSEKRPARDAGPASPPRRPPDRRRPAATPRAASHTDAGMAPSDEPFPPLDAEAYAEAERAESLRQAWANWLRRFGWAHYCLLTSERELGREAFARAFSAWTRRLTRVAQQGVQYFCALEIGPNGGRCHIHALVAGTECMLPARLAREWPLGGVDIQVYDAVRGGTWYVVKAIAGDPDSYQVSERRPPLGLTATVGPVPHGVCTIPGVGTPGGKASTAPHRATPFGGPKDLNTVRRGGRPGRESSTAAPSSPRTALRPTGAQTSRRESQRTASSGVNRPGRAQASPPRVRRRPKPSPDG